MAPRHLERVQRFESLLAPFPSASDSPTSSSSPRAPSDPSLAAIGERAPGFQARGPQSAEQWRQDELRRLCFHGIPDDPKYLRPAAYAFLLALPPPSVLVEQYSAFLADIATRISSLPPPDLAAPLIKEDVLLREIEQDVDRTFGALAWFGAEVEMQEGEEVLWARLDALRGATREPADELAAREGRQQDSPSAAPSARPHSRRRALLRPLFAYAFLNPGVSFVQGMSYLAAVFAFVFSAPPSSTSAIESEATTFFALGALLSQLRDLYVPTLDAPSSSAPTAVGLGATVARFSSLLLFLDPTVADALDRKNVDLSAFVMRWLTTVFANEFPLPDVVRIWDRVLSLYPPTEGPQAAEPLSPVLSHLLDLALALVETERQTIISPFAKLPKIMTVLQHLRVEGDGIDTLLRTAADIRDRRTGRNKRASATTTPTRSGTVFGRRLWSASPAKSSDAAGAEYELDDRSSAAGSDASRPSRLGQRFGSLAFSSPRSSATADLADNLTMVEGKVLPPPPARVDQQADTIASLIEDELRVEAEYGVDDEDEESGASSLRDRAASGWGGLKSSLSRFAASDAAAALQKRATNLQLAAAQSASSASARLQSSDAAAALFKAQTNASVKAQLLAEQLAHDTPERLAKLRDAGGRLVASTGSDRGGERRPGSPREAPFTPPGGCGDRDVSPISSPRLGAVDMARGGSNGPRPLLLSSAARRAKSDEDGSHAFARSRSPSQSPILTRASLLSPDLSIPPLSRSPSSHGRSLSHFDSPSRSPASTFRPRSPSLQQSSPMQDDDSPIVSRRVQDGAAGLRRGGPASSRHEGSPSAASARSAGAGRAGWSLSDAPVRVGAQVSQPSAGRLPPLELGFDPSTLSESVEVNSATSHSTRSTVYEGPLLEQPVRAEQAREAASPGPGDEPFLPPSEAPFLPPSFSSSNPAPHDEPFIPPTASGSPPPPRGSSLGLSTSHPARTSLPAPAPVAGPLRQSSLASLDDTSSAPAATVLEADAPTPTPRLSRRPAAQRKRTSRLSQASVDLSAPEARRVASEFLTRSTSGASSVRPSHSRRASEVRGPGSRASVATFDESALVDSYGGEGQ
ncbi:hypothetical protein JCM9279_002015 [Rhodotorula babjevae]